MARCMPSPCSKLTAPDCPVSGFVLGMVRAGWCNVCGPSGFEGSCGFHEVKNRAHDDMLHQLFMRLRYMQTHEKPYRNLVGGSLN